eukprot:gnl/MRDRNA2_/MRDRNA2_80246_c0_seq1.p1 gnl/MRDRNA2_/MRDRNA2_80246_c0~~gnl/MRDRNA2_/MRDRNA2_80246_c0_seq1.p1  ORF type:complete len:559 (+),score=65.81 gnl/MRDRNA2_/MRDRNA2_80246_c0_seq1:87-1679(+)
MPAKRKGKGSNQNTDQVPARSKGKGSFSNQNMDQVPARSKPLGQTAPTLKNDFNKAIAVAQTEPEDSFDRTTLFTKTKMCKFHLAGICAKGASCAYAHDPMELNNLPDLFRTKLCKSLICTGQCNDPECKYAHNKEELRSTSQLRKSKMCKFWLEGRCELGDCCSYAHDPSELNQTPLTLQSQSTQAVPKPLPSGSGNGGYAVTPQMAFQKASLPHMIDQVVKPSSSEDVPSVAEEPRQVMVIDAKTGKALAAGTMKTGDTNGSIHVMPAGMPNYPVDSGTSPPWCMAMPQELYNNANGPLLHQVQKELNPVKISTHGITNPTFWQPNQNNLGQLGNGLTPSTSASSNMSSLQVNEMQNLTLSPSPLRKVPSVGDHRPQPAALGQPKTGSLGSLASARNLSSYSLNSLNSRNLSSHSLTGALAGERNLSSNSLNGLGDSPLRGSPLRTPEMRPLSTPEFHGASAPLDIWGCSDPFLASQLPVQLERMSGGDWVVRNTFVDTDEPLRNYPMRPVASCIGRFESLAEADEGK